MFNPKKHDLSPAGIFGLRRHPAPYHVGQFFRLSSLTGECPAYVTCAESFSIIPSLP